MKRDFKRLKPGWKMTEGQWLMFWRLWGDACKSQGWDTLPAREREAKRIEVLADLGFASAKLIDKTAGFDRVKRRLEELSGTIHATQPDGERTRLLHRIGETATAMGEAGCPGEYIDSILRDFGVIPGVRDITQLAEADLLTLSRTLTARLAAWEEKATV